MPQSAAACTDRSDSEETGRDPGEPGRQARMLALALDAARTELTRALAEAARLDRERALAAEEALRRAEETAQLREQFIAILGHDLRSPLGAIVLTAEDLLEGEPDRETLVKHAQRIRRSAERIDRMVDALMDFARARLGGGMPITPQPIFDLASFFGQVIDEIGSAHPGRRIVLDVSGVTDAWWDPDRIAQVLSNLLGNALKHSPPDTEVRVDFHAEDDRVILRVHNHGPPIPPALLERLFEPFKRAVDGATGVRSGLGLGLYIADAIVRAHGGTIAVRSSAEQGTTFTVKLPQRAPGA